MVAIKEAQASCLVFGNPEPVFSVLKLGNVHKLNFLDDSFICKCST